MIKKVILLVLVCCLGASYFYLQKQGYLYDFNTAPQKQSVVHLKKASFEVPEIPNIMSVEEFHAHIYMSSEDLSEITSSWIPYYHRHKNEQDALDVIIRLLDNQNPDERSIKFFEVLLHENQQLLNDLDERSDSMSLDKKAVIEKIIHSAKNYTYATFSNNVDHEKIWAEFAYSGDITLVEKYVRLIDPTRSDFGVVDQEKVEGYLIKKARIYYPVNDLINRMASSPESGFAKKMFGLKTKLNKRFYRTSISFFYLARNHIKTKNYDEALSACLQGLYYAPDDPYLYRSIGEILVEKNMTNDAITSFKLAKLTSPKEKVPALLFLAGKAYEKKGELSNAVKMYQEAISVDPDYVPGLVNITYAYYRLGDKENTVSYAKEILIKSDKIKNLAWAKHVLEDYGIDTPLIKENFDRIQNSLPNLLVRNNFDKLEKEFQKALNNTKMDDEGKFVLHSEYSKLSLSAGSQPWQFEQLLPHYLKWLEAHPGSHFANACLGMFYLDYAWNARGNGLYKTVSAKGSELFRERIRLAAQYLTKAYELDPTDVAVADEMITVAKVHPDWPDSETEKWYKLAVKANPQDSEPYKSKYYYLSPKWGGSLEEQFDFARHTFEDAPQTSMAPIILAKLHWQIYHNEKDFDYFRREDVWEETKKVYNEILNRFPNSQESHNWFARTACLAGDFEMARKEFEIIGDDRVMKVWGSEENFQVNKRLAYSKL